MKVFLSCLMLLVSLSLAAEENFTIPADAIIIKQANERFQKLNQEIGIFLEKSDKLLKENEPFLREVGQWQKAVAEQMVFRKNIQKLQEEFLVFRDHLSQVVGDNYGPCEYSRLLQAASIRDATEWYANHIEKMVFPEHWKPS